MLQLDIFCSHLEALIHPIYNWRLRYLTFLGWPRYCWVLSEAVARLLAWMIRPWEGKSCLLATTTRSPKALATSSGPGYWWKMAKGRKKGHSGGKAPWVGRSWVWISAAARKIFFHEISVKYCNLWPVLFNWMMCEVFQLLIICIICGRHSHQFKKEPGPGVGPNIFNLPLRTKIEVSII